MEQIINFRSTIDDLTPPEFHLFCTKLYKVFNKRQLIIKSLFYLLIEDFKHNKCDHVSKLNQITKQIMDQRKKNESLSLCTTISPINNITINYLASPLLSHLASYLTLPEQISFLRCNRYILSSLTSSLFTINQLIEHEWFSKYKNNNGPQYYKYQMIKLKRFRLIKDINIHRKNIEELYCSFPWKIINFHTLRFIEFFIAPGFDVFYNSILRAINILKQTNIKHLILQDSWIETGDKNDYFIKLMEANTNIKCLSLNDIDCNNNHLIQNAMRKLVIKLKGLIIKQRQRKTSTIPNILSIIGNQLLSLHLNFGLDCLEKITFTKNKMFNNLNELCVNEYVNKYIMCYIVNHAIHLKRLHWEISHDENIINMMHVKHIFESIWIKRNEIEYLCVYTSLWKSFEMFYDIFMKHKCVRRNMKIIWYFKNELEGTQVKYLKNHLWKFVNVLHECIMNDFMFILRISGIYEELKQIDEIWDKKNDCLYLTNVRTENETYEKNDTLMVEKQIVICNEANSMCGYRERWNYSCPQCCVQFLN